MGLADKLKGDAGEKAEIIQRQTSYDKDYEEFLKDPLVVQYRKELDQRAATKEKLIEYNQSPPIVHKILTRLNLSPSAFLFEESNMNGAEKLRKIKEALKPVRDEVLLNARKKAEAKGEISQDTAWYAKAKALRSFIKFSGISVPPQSVKEFAGKYSKLRAEPLQIKEMKRCLQANKDAYFMFLLSLEIGFRANEAFTISTRRFSNDRESGIEKMQFGGKTRYRIQMLTRKSAWVGQYTHKVLILDDECTELIKERLQQVEDGIGIVEKKNRVGTLTDHSLIGFDDQYLQVNTLQNPKPKQTTQQKQNQNALMDFFRQCYKRAELDDPYYTKKPFHSMRHIFAQYWLNKTSYDYQFVADLGHWKTLSVLKDSYGGMPDELFFQKQAVYHDREHKKISEEANEKISEAELNAVAETYKTDLNILHKETKKKEEAKMKKMADK